MIPLLYILSIVFVFALLLAFETGNDPNQVQPRQFGLWSWLATGNWPAKVGAGLLIIGIGALMRYAILHSTVPPEVKLGIGFLLTAILAAASFSLRAQEKRKAIHLALAGAAFGVAYLTAYSAYGFFNYITDVNALTLLALVASAAGVFAVSSNAISVGVLAMTGAYLAPAFALGEPGPLPVYGYYLLASLLSLTMVTMRGWRALIHLSFLFTIGGGVFFAWTAEFFRPEHYVVMQPLLLALAAVHLAMPITERRHAPGPWLARFDAGYFCLLPLTAAVCTIMLAPEIDREASLGLFGLALIWGLAAAILKALKRDEAPRHLLVAGLLSIAAIMVHLHDIPWSLYALSLSVAVLAFAPMIGLSKMLEGIAYGATLWFALIYVAGSSTISLDELQNSGLPLSPWFSQRGVTIVLLSIGAALGIRRNNAFGKVLGATALALAIMTLATALRILDIDFAAQLVYSILLGCVVVAAIAARKTALPNGIGLLLLALPLSAWYANALASEAFIVFSLIATPICLLALAWPNPAIPENDDRTPAIALALLPILLALFANGSSARLGHSDEFLAFSTLSGCSVLTALLSRHWQREDRPWHETMQTLQFIGITGLLLYVTLLHIQRGALPMLFELSGLAFLTLVTLGRYRSDANNPALPGTVTVLLAGLVLQAMLLRLIGPPLAPGVAMNIGDLVQMKLPAVISLMWACFGGGLTWWGAKSQSRPVWSAGSLLLVIAAAKLILLDFSSLGQLSNILAMIASGLVFLGVAWLAPMPPAQNQRKQNKSAGTPAQEG